MYFLPPTDFSGYLRRLHIAFWTSIVCAAVFLGAIFLSRDDSTEQVGAFGLVFLAGVVAFGYYLILLDHIAFRLKKNGGLWVLISVVLGPLGYFYGYVKIVSDAKWHIATSVGEKG